MKIPKSRKYLHGTSAGSIGPLGIALGGAGAIFLGVVVLIGLQYTGIIHIFGQNVITPPGTTQTASTSNIYSGQLTVAVTVVQSADQNTKPTLSSQTFSAYTGGSAGGQLSQVSSASQMGTLTSITYNAAGSAVQINPSDKGQVLMLLDAGTYYIDVNKLVAMNPSIVAIRWPTQQCSGSVCIGSPINIQNGVRYNMLVQVNAANVVASSGQTPSQTITVPVIQDDTASVSATAPSTLTAQGTTTVTLTSEWKVSGFTAQHGIEVQRIYFSSNQSAGTALQVNPQSLTISGIATYSSTSFTVNTCGTTASGIANCWDFYNPAGAANQPGVGLVIINPVGGAGTLFFDLQFVRSLSTGSKTSLTLNLYMLSPAGAATTLTSKSQLSA